MTQPTAEQIEVTQEVKDQHAIAMGDIDKNFGILSAATSGTARLILAHMLGQTAAIQATEARMAAIEEALRPFAGMRKSTEPEVSDLLNRSPSEQLRRQAELTERRDREIDNARLALGKGSE